MSVRVCRWGIVSTASIGRKNWQAIGRAGNASLGAVSSRSREAAERFIEENLERFPHSPRPAAYGSYEELLDDESIDAVYLPLPTGLRKEFVIAAARKGKHVLCEKPCAVSYQDLLEMTNACRENGVQFMDGVMYMHTERLERMGEALRDPGVVGDLKRIATQFSFCAPEEFFRDNIRVDSRLEPQGCLGDLGWYTIRLALWAAGGQLPRSVRGTILSEVPCVSGGSPIPTEFSGELLFENGLSASLYVSFITGHQQWAVLSGTRGLIHVDDFVLPNHGDTLRFETRVSEFNQTGWDFNMDCDRVEICCVESSNMADSAQETKLFRNFSNLVLTGTPDESWPEWSLQTQQVLDALLASGRRQGTPVELAATTSV